MKVGKVKVKGLRKLTRFSYQGSSSGSHPSSSIRQKKQQATSGSFWLGQWTKPALAIYKDNSNILYASMSSMCLADNCNIKKKEALN